MGGTTASRTSRTLIGLRRRETLAYDAGDVGHVRRTSGLCTTIIGGRVCVSRNDLEEWECGGTRKISRQLGRHPMNPSGDGDGRYCRVVRPCWFVEREGNDAQCDSKICSACSLPLQC